VVAAESGPVAGQRWLAVSSSGATLSVALAVGNQRYVHEVAPTRGSPRQITPLIDAVLHQAQLTLADVDVWVVDTGPGTFTGLRQGLALLRGFAFALQKPLYGVSALDALVAQSPEPTALVVLPARTDTWYVGLRHQGLVTQVCLTAADLTNWWSAQQITTQTPLGVVGPSVLSAPWQALLAPYSLVPLATTLSAAQCLDVAQLDLIPLAGPDPLLVVPHYLLASEPEQARGEIQQVVLPADQRVPWPMSGT
jgi:tRNA threonylcarbamoyl adenosine modification protein YeaZ